MFYVASIFSPLVGALIAGFFGRALGHRASAIVCCVLLAVGALSSWVVFYEVVFLGEAHDIELFIWIDSGAFEVSWALRFDVLTAVMVFVVTTVSCIIHV
ncbi:MAG: NADH-quinone oxidoreductase subunit L, partial [Alphaproteobacteria bacterium]